MIDTEELIGARVLATLNAGEGMTGLVLMDRSGNIWHSIRFGDGVPQLELVKMTELIGNQSVDVTVSTRIRFEHSPQLAAPSPEDAIPEVEPLPTPAHHPRLPEMAKAAASEKPTPNRTHTCSGCGKKQHFGKRTADPRGYRCMECRRRDKAAQNLTEAPKLSEPAKPAESVKLSQPPQPSITELQQHYNRTSQGLIETAPIETSEKVPEKVPEDGAALCARGVHYFEVTALRGGVSHYKCKRPGCDEEEYRDSRGGNNQWQHRGKKKGQDS